MGQSQKSAAQLGANTFKQTQPISKHQAVPQCCMVYDHNARVCDFQLPEKFM